MTKTQTIWEVVNHSYCVGCGTCVALCPQDAICISKNAKGQFLPTVNFNKCNSCGVCKRVCPSQPLNNIEYEEQLLNKLHNNPSIGNYTKCYVGHALNHEIRFGSSSGGLVTALLIFALEEGLIDGVLVTRMSKDNPLKPEPFIATTREEIIESSKSKYCPVPVNIVLREIMVNDGKYAVVGLPCHIQGIRKAEAVNHKLKGKIVFHIAIFCSGTPNFLATEYLLRKLKINRKNVHSMSYRGQGWPGNLVIYMNSGKIVRMPYPIYWSSFVGYFFLNVCDSCLDWFGEYADVSIGDAWLSEVTHNDKIGTSVIISRNCKIDETLDKMKERKIININNTNADKILESQAGFNRKMKRLSARISLSNISNKSVHNGKKNITLSCSLVDYILMAKKYTGRFCAIRRRLWILFDLYCFLLNKRTSAKPK